MAWIGARHGGFQLHGFHWNPVLAVWVCVHLQVGYSYLRMSDFQSDEGIWNVQNL